MCENECKCEYNTKKCETSLCTSVIYTYTGKHKKENQTKRHRYRENRKSINVEMNDSDDDIGDE